MKNKKLSTAICILLILTMIFTGCSNDKDVKNPVTDDSEVSQNNDNEQENDKKDEDALDKEQYINDHIESDPSTLDSSKTGDSYSSAILTEIMEALVRYEEDENGNVEVQPAGAKSWVTNEDKTVWTFTLNDNKWSDGVAVTAYDYEYGMKRSLDPNVGGIHSYLLGPIKNANAVNSGELPVEEVGVKALDEKTLEITLEYPTSYLLKLTIITSMLPQRKDIVEKYGDAYGSEANTLVCNGPFKIESWIHNNEIILKKNEHYWDKDLVKLETINYKILQDTNSIYNSFESGSLDSATATTPEWIEKFSSNDEMDWYHFSSNALTYQYFNQKDPVLSNVKVRKALSLAIDREELANVISEGVNDPAYGFLPKAMTVGDVNYRDTVEEPFKKAYDEGIDPKKLLVEGLIELGMDPDPSKIDLTFSIGGTDQWSKTYGEYMQQIYKEKLGIDLKLELLDWGVFYANFYDYNYQMGYMYWGTDFNDPICFLEAYHSALDGMVIGYKNERVDELLDLAKVEVDESKKLEYYKEIENIVVYEDCCTAPVTYPNTNQFRYKYVKGVDKEKTSTKGYKYAYTSGRE